jgi:hypothetical protein
MKSKTYGLQQETRTYLRRLYAYGRELRGEDINDIDEFIKGLKQLNLWQNTVCWPMRSIHNIGTGSKVLSLGGGGTYDGTMVNSPTWGTGGITNLINNSNVYIDIPTLNINSPAGGVITCVAPRNLTNGDGAYIGSITQKFQIDGIVGGAVTNPASRFVTSAGTGILDLVRYQDSYSILSVAYSGTGSLVAKGNTTRVSSTVTGAGGIIAPATNNLILMNWRKNTGSAGQTNAFCAYLTSGMFENHLTFYKLLKTTICKDLGVRV